MTKLLASLLAFMAGVFGFAVTAHAELPAGVATAITAAQTDGTTLIGLLAAFGAALWLIAKVLRKFGVMG